MRVTLLLLAQAAAFWPVWRWYVLRLGDGSESTWGLLALGVALFFAVRDRRPGEHVAWHLPAILVAVYAVGFPFLPPLGRGMLAMLSLAVTLGMVTGAPKAGLAGLFLLALPVLPTAQFLLGHPLRVLVSHLAAAMLTMNGFSVAPQGACLSYDGALTCVDVPCSGISMLWTGGLLAMLVACAQRLSTSRTMILAAATGLLVVLGNALRVTSLFFLEVTLGGVTEPLHQALGMVVFVLAAVGVVWAGQRLGRAPCAA